MVGKKGNSHTWRIDRFPLFLTCVQVYGHTVRDFIKKDCAARGSGWSHGGVHSNDGRLVQCFKQGDVVYKTGACHTTPAKKTFVGW